MDKLLKIASQAADQAEVYYQESTSDSVEFNDSKLTKCDSKLRSGVALRVIKDGKMGLAHTRNLLDREALVKQALLSAENGVEVGFQMPLTRDLPELELYDSSIEKITKQQLVETGNRTIEYIKKRTDGQLNLGFGYGTGSSAIMNSAGTNLASRGSGFGAQAMMIFPGTGSGLFQFQTGRSYKEISTAELDELLELYSLSKTEIVPATKRMPVIFTPISLFGLLSRLSAASSPVSIYNKVSPLCGRIGEKIVSEKFSLWEDPFDLDLDNAGTYDAEGVPTRRIDFIEKGVFKAIPTDLNYAQKLGMEPNGCAVRHSVENLPGASESNVCVAPGDISLKDMIASIGEGILAYFLMGAHSGNVLHGDYSVGVSAGFMIQNGKITGRVKDCLLSGNAYETLSNIEAVEDRCLTIGSHKLPSILCKDVSVAGK
jgi:PmbA protein